jgi:hypothetical protein
MITGLLIGLFIGFFVGALFMVTALRRVADRIARGVFGPVEQENPEQVDDLTDPARRN